MSAQTAISPVISPLRRTGGAVSPASARPSAHQPHQPAPADQPASQPTPQPAAHGSARKAALSSALPVPTFGMLSHVSQPTDRRLATSMGQELVSLPIAAIAGGKSPEPRSRGLAATFLFYRHTAIQASRSGFRYRAGTLHWVTECIASSPRCMCG